MSVKAMSLVWDLECPKVYGDVAFKPSHKYVLIAYADHADHTGRNIFPAVPTIAKKTGLDDRTVQRLTNDLEAIGLLIEDGKGPRGTNRWALPFNDGGDKLSPVAICRGDKSEKSLGDISSGDIPSGDKLTPEVKEPEPDTNIDKGITEQKHWDRVLVMLQDEMSQATFNTWVKDTQAVRFDGSKLVVHAPNDPSRDWLNDRIRKTAERLLVGILGREVAVEFVVQD